MVRAGVAKDALRISFGIIWLIDAVLKWLPGFRSDYMATIMGQADGQPGWLKPWFDFWINLQHPGVMFFAYLVAAAETLIAVALIAGFARKLTYISAAAFSVIIWATAEGFGGPYTSGSADIGTAVICAVVFMGLLALSYYAGPARYSADYYLEKISWWRRVAELRRPLPGSVPFPQGRRATRPARQPAQPDCQPGHGARQGTRRPPQGGHQEPQAGRAHHSRRNRDSRGDQHRDRGRHQWIHPGRAGRRIGPGGRGRAGLLLVRVMSSQFGGGGSIMDGTTNGSKMGSTGYQWMTGLSGTAPAWMRGHGRRPG